MTSNRKSLLEKYVLKVASGDLCFSKCYFPGSINDFVASKILLKHIIRITNMHTINVYGLDTSA